MKEVQSIYDPGVVTLITGRMGTGKTDFALMLAEIGMKRKGLTVLTNIILHEPFEGIVQTTKASELLRELAEEKQYLTILDEAGLYANSKQVKNKDNMSLVKLLLVIRKFTSSIFFINQRDMETAKTIRELSMIEFHKDTKKTARLFADFKTSVLLHDIPQTNIPYDTRAIAYFSIDIDIEKLFEDLSNVPYKKAMKKLREIAKEGFSEYQPTSKKRDVEKKEIPKTRILEVLAKQHPEWSQNELARVVGVSPQYVNRLVKTGKL